MLEIAELSCLLNMAKSFLSYREIIDRMKKQKKLELPRMVVKFIKLRHTKPYLLRIQLILSYMVVNNYLLALLESYQVD